MSKEAHLVVIPGYQGYRTGWVPERRFVAKAGAPEWVDRGEEMSPETDIKGFLTVICAAPIAYTLVTLFCGTGVATPWWLWVADAVVLGPLAWLSKKLWDKKGEFKKWTLQLNSADAAELVNAVGELRELGAQYNLDEGMLYGWESRLLEAASEIDKLGQESDRYAEKRGKAIRSAATSSTEGSEYVAALTEHVDDLDEQIYPVKEAAKELINQVTALCYAKKAAEVRGLVLPVSPVQAAALSLLDEVARVKELTAAYTQLATDPSKPVVERD